jgi:hypothetical protein
MLLIGDFLVRNTFWINFLSVIAEEDVYTKCQSFSPDKMDKVETQFPPVQKSDRWIRGGVWGHTCLYTRWGGMSGMEIIKFGCVLIVHLSVHFYTPVSRRHIMPGIFCYSAAGLVINEQRKVVHVLVLALSPLDFTRYGKSCMSNLHREPQFNISTCTSFSLLYMTYRSLRRGLKIGTKSCGFLYPWLWDGGNICEGITLK